MIPNYSDFFSSMLTTSSVSVLLRLKMPSKAESVPNIRTTPFRVTERTYKIQGSSRVHYVQGFRVQGSSMYNICLIPTLNLSVPRVTTEALPEMVSPGPKMGPSRPT